jgi:hypothetical protein
MSDLLTVVEAARLASVSTGTIQYWIRTGRLTERRAPRSEYSLKVRPGERIQRLLIDREELIAATPDGIEAAVRRANRDKKLISLRDIQRYLGLGHMSTACKIVQDAGVRKYPLYGNTFLVDGDELYTELESSPTLSMYLHKARLKGLTI